VLSPDEAEKMAQLVRLNFETMHLFAMNRTERGRCLEVILLYYRLHVPEFGELKSVEVLKELFD
jgi:DNA repair protein RecO (recombination protein O)